MMVTFCDSSACVLGSSGLTNAYRSVLSAAGSWLISGASRWLEALAASGPEPRTSATVTAAASPRTTRKARAFLCIPSPSLGLSRRIRTMGQFGSANRNEAARECPRMAVLALSAPSARRRASMARDLAHLSDEALVALAARMDDLALAELYDRFGHAAYGLALRIVRDPALAEDAVQEAFLTLWRSASRFVPERAKASTWILTLVHRRAVDIVRREQPRRTQPIEAAPQASASLTEDEAWLRLQRTRVQEALRQLPDQQREALELAYFGGFTQSQLAERLGEPLGTIKSRMFTGLSRLRDLLAEPEPGERKWQPRPSTT